MNDYRHFFYMNFETFEEAKAKSHTIFFDFYVNFEIFNCRKKGGVVKLEVQNFYHVH